MGKEITFDKFIRWAGVTLIVLAVLYMTNYLSRVLLPFFIAWFFAYLLYPVVKFIENKLHIKIRALSILIAMGTAIAVIGGVLWLIIPPMIDQFDKLGEVLTRWLHQTTHTNNLTALIKDWLQANQEQIEHFLKSKDFSDAIKATMPKVFSVVSQTATVLMSIVASMITLLYMFFILLDYETLTANWVRIFPKKNRPFWSALMKDVERELNNYIRGQGLVALCMGIMFCIGFTIIGFPMERRLQQLFQFIFLDREKDGGKGMDRAVKKKYCQFFQSGLKNSGFRKHGSKRTEKLPGAEIQKPFKQSF